MSISQLCTTCSKERDLQYERGNDQTSNAGWLEISDDVRQSLLMRAPFLLFLPENAEASAGSHLSSCLYTSVSTVPLDK